MIAQWRLDKLAKAIIEDNVCRGVWSIGDKACLLGHLYPEVIQTHCIKKRAFT